MEKLPDSASIYPQSVTHPDPVTPHTPPATPQSHIITPDMTPAPTPPSPEVQAPASDNSSSNSSVQMLGTMPTNSNSNASRIVLQWLTYTYWGWTVLILSILTSLVISSFLGNNDLSFVSAYAVAGVIVLLPVSFFVDMFFSKQEEPEKAGGELAILVIHAVIFSLLGISSLISAVYAVVAMLTSNTDSTTNTILLISSIIIAFFYGILLLRTFLPGGKSIIGTIFRYFMLVAVGIIAILGITGPVAKERAQRNDKLIEVNATKVTKAIADYNKNNGKLPDSLNDINLEGDAKKLVTDKLVTYKKETTTSTATPTPKATTSKSSSSSSSNLSDDYYNSYSSLLSASQAKYQLCATFVNKSEGFTKDDSQSSDNYSSYINATQHPSGEVCYKMYASSY